MRVMDGRSRLPRGPLARQAAGPHQRSVTVELEAGWLETSVGLRVIDDRMVVAVRGDDARTWLNGQLTNDVKPLAANRAVFGLLLTPKGRILADATAHEHEGAIYVDVPRSAWAALALHLEKYIIMEDVTLAESPELTVVTAQGPRAAELLPSGSEHDRLRRGGRDQLLRTSTLDASLATLGRAATDLGGGLVSDAGWELARIRAGVARFGRDFDEHVYPQEAGLEKTAVSFQKGCYLGQEVICMLESRGQVSRRLAKLEADADVAVGDTLKSAAGDEVGRVSSVVRDATGVHALGLVKRAMLADGTPLTAGAAGLRVTGAT